MLVDRHQLDVRIAHLLAVIHQLVRQLAIGEPAAGVVGGPFPTAQVHLVERQGPLEPIGLAAPRNPGRIVPAVTIQVDHFGGRPRGHFGGEAHRIGLLENRVLMPDLVLVKRAFAQAGHEQLPEAAGDVLSHGVPAVVPVVEVAHHAHPAGIGGPQGEIHPFHPVDHPQVRAQAVVALPVPAFVEQIQIVLGQQVRECVRVVHSGLLSPLIRHPQQIAARGTLGRTRTYRLVQARRVNPAHGPGRIPVRGVNHPSLRRLGQISPNRQDPAAGILHFVRSQHLEWILVLSFNQLVDTLQGNRGSHTHLLAGVKTTDIAYFNQLDNFSRSPQTLFSRAFAPIGPRSGRWAGSIRRRRHFTSWNCNARSSRCQRSEFLTGTICPKNSHRQPLSRHSSSPCWTPFHT